MAGRRIDAALSLLDRQMIDKDGFNCGKVDDVEFEWPTDGSPPYAVAILAGPGALSNRLGGRLGRLLSKLHKRLHDLKDPDPARVSFGIVKGLDDHLELTVSRDDLEVGRVKDWVGSFISKIPGAGHAPE